MSKLYLMRHGETYFNLWHKIQGWCDSPLTEKGKEQAKHMHKYFQKNNIQLTKAYCSTSERASDTLELVTDLPYTRLKGLKECYFGSFEAQDERLNPQPPYKDFFLAYGGESEDQVQKRMHDNIFKIMANTDDEDQVLVVSHASAILNFALTLGLDPMKIKDDGFSNCSIIVFDYQDGKLKFEKIVNPE